MEHYTDSVNKVDKKSFKKWVGLAKAIYGFGLIRSSEAALFYDLSNEEISIQTTNNENEISLSPDIKAFLNSGDSPLVLIHNHIGKETSFSNRDIEVLFDYPRINYLLVINSKMEIFILGRTEQLKSRETVMELFWDWWSNSEKKANNIKIETINILSQSPTAIHATEEEYQELLNIEDDVISALHNMTSHSEFIKFANDACFCGAYLQNA